MKSGVRKRESKDADVGQVRRKKRKEERKQSASIYKAILDGNDAEQLVNIDAGLAPALAPESSVKKVIVVLDCANLEVVKRQRGSGSTLLAADEHKGIIKRSGKDPAEVRPDVAHQCLLALLDSPLNKRGHLQVYVRTSKNVLIELHPQLRLPRTFRRFSGLMAELLNKFKIRATNSQDTLMKVIRNPITSHLPVGSAKFAFSFNSEKMVNVVDHAKEIVETRDCESVVYVIGAMAKGKVEADWVEDTLSISNYPLSGACVCNRLAHAYELALNIL
uniref:Ribosomal RNA small subunit methyltransferase NEP1 n=1 Tax=Rhodosorus marinus TaxID=101924 RepID=A0A7S0BQR3_9RHOD|mmetsp:Transcript_4257/g.6041  ORF Transcript_4257/g.6041 Transcript_4257/m.6041 type:complete len:276 (+) Transcript_4257:198-1025(+)